MRWTRGRNVSLGRGLIWLFGLALLAVGGVWLHRRLLCAGLLLRMEQARDVPGVLLHFGERPVTTRPFSLPSGTQALLYEARAVSDAPGLVLAHGIHEQGIHEKRLTAFARALASSGYTVLTPEIAQLARFRVTHAGAETIAEAARALAKHLGVERVAVFGVSFGGGLALRAACEPGRNDAIGRVIALGAHHDANVVTRFYLGERPRGPDSGTAELEPHGYGGTVLFASLFGERHRGPINDAERNRLRAALSGRARELSDASPSHCPGPLSVPVHLAHGLGDRIVPYTETLWNARQFGRQTQVETLISAAIGHAGYAQPSLWERFRLVDFIARALY